MLKKIWVLFDISNGRYPKDGYAWFFTKRKDALREKKEHENDPYLARVSRPVKYVLSKEFMTVPSLGGTKKCMCSECRKCEEPVAAKKLDDYGLCQRCHRREE